MKHFKQSYTQKPVRRYAPDGFILLNQLNYLESPKGERINFNDDVTNLSINGSIDAPPSSASFQLSIPRSEYGRYFSNGKPIIFPMMEVKIFIKGRYYVLNNSGTIEVPPPYQQFHGVIKSVSESYSGETHTLSIQCVDLLYWMQITKMNLRPSVLAMENTGAASVPYVGVFKKKNPKEIIKEIVNFAFGGQRKSADGTPINAAFVPETFNSISFTGALRSSVYEPVSKKDLVDLQNDILADYWTKRMGLDQEADTNFIDLIIFGYKAGKGEVINRTNSRIDPTSKVNSSDFRSQQKQLETAQESQPQPVALSTEGSQSVSQSVADVDAAVKESVSASFDSTGFDILMQQLIDNASPYGQIASVDTIDNSSFSSLMDIAITCRDYIGYEFYMSLDGQLVFKPPFYNIDVRAYRPFVIKDEDIFDFSFEESDDVFTMFTVKGNLTQAFSTAGEIQHVGVAFDARLAEKYGIRAQTTDLQMVGSFQESDQSKLLAIYAQNEMDRHNSKRMVGTITIPLTPEIKMGYPIYIEEKNCFAYVTGISHSLSFGSSGRTTLQISAFRYKSPYGPNMVMRPGIVDPKAILNKLAYNELSNEKNLLEQQNKIRGTGTKINQRRQVTSGRTTDGEWYSSGIQPITDTDGYELVGVISYGSNLLIDTSGQIQPKKKSLNLDTSNQRLQITRKLSNMQPTSSVNDKAQPQPVSQTKTTSKANRDGAGKISNMTPPAKQNTSGKGK
jgi:hypothetical protein